MNILKKWYQDYLTDPQIMILLLVCAGAILILMTMGEMLTPVIISLILAYLLEGLVHQLERTRMPRLAAVSIVFIIFLLAFLFLFLQLIPLLSKQIGQFVQDLPQMISTWQSELKHLPKKYPNFVSEEQIKRILVTINNQLGNLGENLLSISLASVRNLINIIIYIVLVPLMVFFFLKDKIRILEFFKGFLPENMDLTSRIWEEVNQKTAKFIQGKIWEIFIVWAVSYITFLLLGMKFSLLLSFLVGLSVIIPYIGATVMTIPVALVAFFQWGLNAEFLYAIIAYLIIQILDGNLLVPLLLSGIVNLHPLAVIIGILIFGGLWGFWGVLFAIPLATVVHAIIKAWPQKGSQESTESN
ncbi:MAG: AI-2E family transporter [Thermodesulfobacteriota bacterium]